MYTLFSFDGRLTCEVGNGNNIFSLFGVFARASNIHTDFEVTAAVLYYSRVCDAFNNYVPEYVYRCLLLLLLANTGVSPFCLLRLM